MDYSKHCCPVCEKQFAEGDDIVVCPDCGTPHHRECYEIDMRCHNAHMHKDGFDYKTEYNDNAGSETNATDKSLCIRCGNQNPAGSSFCNSCGAPLADGKVRYQPYDRHDEESDSAEKGNVGFGGQGYPQRDGAGQPFEVFSFDPMGGIKADQEIGDNVTAGEAAKFVKNNTPFYTRIFYSIRKFNRSRFNFASFLFTGIWMMYRKMYKLGTIITLLMALLIGAQMYVTVFYTDMMVGLQEAVNTGGFFVTEETTEALQSFLSGLDSQEMFALGVSYFSYIGQVVIRFVCGACSNRWYYKHCINKISKIKTNAETKEKADAELQTKGGVNMALTVSLLVSYMILSFLPGLF